MKIDSHQHFWAFDPERDTWIDATMKRIQMDFGPNDLKPHLDKHRFDGCIAVQADESHVETQHLLHINARHPWVKKVVGWLDLRSENIEKELEQWSDNENLAGFRQVLQGLDPDVMYDVDFRKGITQLEKYGLTFDLLIYPQHLKAANDLVKDFPNQRFVIDHLAKPSISTGTLEPWKSGIQQIALNENVYCKFSGMVTEAAWDSWNVRDLLPYTDTVLDCFGPHRLMYGSDWPVMLLAATYDDWLDVAMQQIETLSTDEQCQVLGQTACHFYGIKS